GAAIVCWSVSLATGSAFWAALASVGAWINLFNLLPVFGLDGGRAFSAMTRAHRWIAVGVLAGAWFATGDGLMILLAIVAGMRATGEGAVKSDALAIWNYAGLVVALSFLVAMNPSML
ncbi:MAG: site-2 protease family protein, partial [Candidatus Hydrogenedentota bacterium]